MTAQLFKRLSLGMTLKSKTAPSPLAPPPLKANAAINFAIATCPTPPNTATTTAHRIGSGLLLGFVAPLQDGTRRCKGVMARLIAPTSFDQGLLNISPKGVCSTDVSEFDCCLTDCSPPRGRIGATTKTMTPRWRRTAHCANII